MRVPVMILFAVSFAPAAHAQDVASLGWLSGCWIEEKGDRVVEESWTTPSGGIMLSTGRTVKAGQLRDYEFTRIEAKNGKLIFTANPAGQAEASFTVFSQTADSIDFADPDHDFPQHVRYSVSGPDMLHAEIEGPMDGQNKIISWDYRRCTP